MLVSLAHLSYAFANIEPQIQPDSGRALTITHIGVYSNNEYTAKAILKEAGGD